MNLILLIPPPERFRHRNRDAFVFEVPDADLELIRLYVKAKVYEQMRSKQAALDRFKLGSGSREDNPIAPEVEDLMKIYHEKIMERIPGGDIELFQVSEDERYSRPDH